MNKTANIQKICIQKWITQGEAHKLRGGNKVKKIQYLSTIDEETFAEISKIADIDDYSTHK